MVSHNKRQEIDDITEIMADADYLDDLVFLANTPAQAKSLPHNLEQASGSIGL